MKFLKCSKCGNIIIFMDEKHDHIICCGEPMEELVPGSVDAAHEKHVPVINESEGKVVISVGEVAHPMLPEHFIEWVVVHTDRGHYIKHLKPGDAPQVEFALLDNEIVFSAYAYCNLHGLWKKVSE